MKGRWCCVYMTVIFQSPLTISAVGVTALLRSPPAGEQITACLSATCYRKNPPSWHTHAIPIFDDSSPSLWASLPSWVPPAHSLPDEKQSGATCRWKMSHKLLFTSRSLSPPSWWAHAIHSAAQGHFEVSECASSPHCPSSGQSYCVRPSELFLHQLYLHTILRYFKLT